MGFIEKPKIETHLWHSLSLAQRGVWLDAKLIADPSAYLLGALSRVAGEVDPALARQAVRVIIGRHDALRLRIDATEPRQRFETSAGAPFKLVDMSREADPDGAVEAYVRGAQSEGFTLGDQPLFRVDLIKVANADWRLLMLCHHLLGDGISIRLVQRHWLQAYNRLLGEDDDDAVESGPAAEAAPTSSYLPVIEDDAAYMASRRYAEDMAYWQQRLTPLPSLVFEYRPPPSLPLEAGAAYALPAPLVLDTSTFARFAASARAANATPHRALMALIGLTLSRRYGAADFAIGMALHRRDHSSAHVIGMLAGMIAVRCRIDASWTVAQTVERVAAEIEADLRHQRTPIDELGRGLALGGQNRKALFDVAVTILPSARSETPMMGGTPVISRSLRGPQGSPLTISARELPDRGGMTIDFGFHPNILSASEIERLRDLLAKAIDAFLTRPALRIAEVDRLTRRERTLIGDWSTGPAIAVPEATLPDLFEAQVGRTPGALAVLADTGALTYAALDAAANRVAAKLKTLDLGPLPVVGVAMARTIDSVVALLGVLKAGAVYLPLDPVYPADRLSGMIADASARVILTNADAASALPKDVPTILFDPEWPANGTFEAAPDRRGSTPDDLAYVIYTSGSTGRPKGVAMAHRAVVNLAEARKVHDPIGPGDRVLAAISIGFDVSIGQLLLPLLSGATVVVAGEVRGLSPEAFWSFMTRHRVSHVNSVPSFFDGMIDGAPKGARLTRLMLGGEPLSSALAARISARLDGTEIVNMYGPTEACIDATAYPVPAQGKEREAVLSIGRPLPNYCLHILDSRLRPVPIGMPGELFIGGAGLARGYLNAADLTAERFLDVPGLGRLYRTGDRGAWGEDGTISFLGRVDAQVKIRGFRVEPTEIEAAILTHPDVAQAAVIGRPDNRGDLRLLAYIVAGPDTPRFEIEALRIHIARALPAHMIPAVFTLLPALPLTPNGKLDARALPDSEAAVPSRAVPPQTAMERLLADMFGDLLGMPSIDVTASFFDLGGHSLLATQLAARLRERLNIELPIRTLFEAPRIVDLAPRIETLTREAAQNIIPALRPFSPRPARLPLSFSQERLWFLHRLDPDSAVYNVPIVLRFEGALDVSALQGAFDALVVRHESLRTRFAEIDGKALQLILPSLSPQLESEDLSGQTIEAAMARVAAELSRPFDLERDPLLRARLLRLGHDTHLLSITMHHIVSDGWSANVLVREMAAFYQAHRHGVPAALSKLPIQYADYALWQRDALAGAELDRQCAYWQTVLADAPPALTLAYDHPRPKVQKFAGAYQPLALSKTLGAALGAFAREEQASLFMVLITAWAGLLSRWSSQDDVVIGAPIANRTRAETESLIGFFVNTLALRLDLSGAPGFRHLVSRMRTRALDAYAHQDLPFEKLVDVLNPRRNLGRHPIFQVMFVLDTADAGALAMPGLAVSPVTLPETAAKFDLTLTLTETADGLRGGITYATDLFVPATIARLAEQFERLLRGVLAEPDLAVREIDILSPVEFHQVLAYATGTVCRARIDTIPALFEAQVARTPQAQAVIFDDTILTYEELNARADRLAHDLIARGIGPEHPVGVCLARSEQLVITAMAVLKAGGVYLPLDPAYPQSRLADMIDDAGAVLVITCVTTASLMPAGIPALCLDAPASKASAACATRPLKPDHLAYIVFTSGSTGRPKGVAVTHGALANLASARLAHDPIGPGDRVLAALSVGFDVAIGQILTPLLRGATIVMAHDLNRMGGADFWDLLRKQSVTHVNSGPSFIEAVIDMAPPGLSLKRLMLGGEPFTSALAQKLRAALPTTELFNLYGPSETCIDATCHRVTGAEPSGTLPIGRPLPNYIVRILDPHMRPTGFGIVGEIFIGGHSLARGYVNRPDLTLERFVQDPLGPEGSRLYRTGDLGRWRPDGTIDFVGRLDSQIKIRGFRVELGEIEVALRTHPAVAGAAALTTSRNGDVVIWAYAVARDGMDRPSISDLRRHLAACLPDHMVPQAFTWLDALPLTVNGKVDTDALLGSDMSEEDKADHTPPRDDLDNGMRAIWRDVLDRDRIGIDDNFFQLGGHSLMALKIASACKTRLGRDMSIALMFQNQTIRELTDALRVGPSQSAPGPLLRIQRGGAVRPLFCVHPVGGSAFCYRTLAEALGSDLPVYGLQASGLAAGEAVAPSLQDMAAAYVEAIRTEQPVGPYRLLGHSFGGLVAFEVARQLEDAGQSVELVALLDSSIPGLDISHAGKAGARLLMAEGLAFGEMLGTAHGGEAETREAETDQIRGVEAVIANNLRLAQGYRPVKVQAPLLYIAAARQVEDDRKVYWSGMSARPLPSRVLPCGHYEMLAAPTIGTLATVVNDGLKAFAPPVAKPKKPRRPRIVSPRTIAG